MYTRRDGSEKALLNITTKPQKLQRTRDKGGPITLAIITLPESEMPQSEESL